ncbi:MAG: ferric-dicitrate binding protein FerR, regulates iron transport through sigma-19 [Verrucomicrobia bacterium]|nr:MAG: ferric-dicitrate binding protein FerR, regulates iron transport through sigma-19 [Verrucomicrobiota bacterium]
MNEPSPLSRARDLILRWCDDRITDGETAELETLLRESPEISRLFAELAHVNATLENLGPAGARVQGCPTVTAPPFSLPCNGWMRPLLSLAAALILLGIPAALVLQRQTGNAPEPASSPARSLAVVNHILGATWRAGDQVLRPGDLIGPSRIRFESGLLQLQFFNGVQAVIEGPADFEILSAEESFCHRGRFHAIVPPQANCFRVRTAQGELIDFGTEFGLEVSPDGAEVHVFDGEVAFQTDDDRIPTRLGVGRAALIPTVGRAQPREANADLFASYREVNQMQAMSTEKRLAEWYQSSLFWRTHPATLAYFDFEEKDYLTGTFRGETMGPYRDPVAGLLVGAQLHQGRWPGKAGLAFSRTSDRVRIHVPGTHRALTLAAWIRVDNLEPRRHALLMSDGESEGSVHWALDGATQRLSFGASVSSGASASQIAIPSEPLATAELLDQWAFLATSYDADRGTVEHSINGRNIGRSLLEKAPSLRIGVADIANWTSPSPEDAHFEGVIDELMIFSVPLTEDQLVGIARTGRPY